MSVVNNVMEFTWGELKELNKEKTVLLITMAPIEEHSWHLPLGTDIYEGERWRQDTIRNLSERFPDYNFLYLPPIPIASAGARGFYGNLHFKQSTVRDVAFELLENIVSWGVKHIIFIASHGDPTHLIAIEEACVKINKRCGVCAFSPMGALFSAKELGLETMEPEEIAEMNKVHSNDVHAGWIETSSMLDIKASMVRSNFQDLPDTKIMEKEMIFSKKVLERMGKYGHLGYPRLGSKELGILLNANLSLSLTDAITAFIERKDYDKYEHHSLFKIPFLRTNFLRNIKIISMSIIIVLLLFVSYRIFM